MPTTTNFGWTTPADTDLVKDGAAAIRTLAGNIDTSLVDLKGGTTGQLLSKNSNTDLDFVYVTPVSGGMTLISETVASALSSLSFSSLGSYKQLYMIWSGVTHSNNSTVFSIRFNNNSGTIYDVGGYINDAVPAYSDTRTNISLATPTTYFSFGENVVLDGRYACKGSLLIDNYTSTTKNKSFQLRTNYYKHDDATYRTMDVHGNFDNNTAITSIDIVRISGAGTFSNQTDTTIRLYGLQ